MLTAHPETPLNRPRQHGNLGRYRPAAPWLPALSIVLLGTLLSATPSSADPPVAHWTLDDGSDTTAADSSTHALDGTVIGTEGAPQWLGTGVLGGALELDGTDDLVTVPDSADLDLATRLTLTMWVRPASLAGNRSLISKDGAYELDLSHVGNGSYSLRLNNVRRGVGGTTLTANVWQHVAVTWDGATVRYYFQGQPDGSSSFAGALSVNSNDLGLGGRPASYSGGFPQFLLNGAIDDVRIYDRDLSAAEILAVYQNQPLPPPPPDNTPPVLFNGSPTGTLPYGTTEVDLTLLTDETAECRYSTAMDVTWSAMVEMFDITGGSYHFETVTGLQDGMTYSYYVRCRETAGNDTPDDYLISFDIEASPPIDLDPPLRSSPSPLGTLPPGTTQVDLTLDTDEDAECRYSETPNTDFSAMVDTFQLTGGQAHSTHISGLSDGTTRMFHVRCRDTSANANDDDLALGFWIAEPAPGSGFHPTDLSSVDFFVESRRGLSIATCNTQACRDAGDNVPLAQQFCDTDTFPNGCIRRWEDQSSFTPPIPFESPEWVAGRDHGQDDLDKPGLILNCLNGRPCVRGGLGEEQFRGLETEPNQHVGPASGPFSLYVLTKPVAQDETFHYLGFAGSELLHYIEDNSLGMRVGFGSQVPLTGPDAVPPWDWYLIEIHRGVDNSITTMIDGYDLTLGNPVMAGNFYFRFLFTASRNSGFFGDFAAALITTGDELTTAEQADLRQYFATVYGLRVGDGNPPPPEIVVPADGLLAEWSFEHNPVNCLTYNAVLSGADGTLGPSCPEDAPSNSAGASGPGLLFDGLNDEILVSADPTLDLLTGISISAWVKTSSTGEYQSIVDKRDGPTDGFDLYVDPGGKPFLRINNRALRGHANLADGQWHHVVGSYDGANMWLFVDGALDSGRVAGPHTLDTSSSLVIGRNYAGSFTFFDGSIDQIRIYDRQLTLAEIIELSSEL